MPRRDYSYFSKPKPVGSFILLLFLLAFGVNLFFNFVLLPLQVRSRSMSPEITSGQRLLYSPLPVQWGEKPRLKRGDLVVITPPYVEPQGFGRQLRNAILRFITFNGVDISQQEGEYLNRYMVRRVIALPGDTVKMDDFVALIKREGEPYFISEFELSQDDYQLELDGGMNDWPQGFPASGQMGELKVAGGEYFVLSDNRYQGNDSRHWGQIKRKSMLGKVIWRY